MVQKLVTAGRSPITNLLTWDNVLPTTDVTHRLPNGNFETDNPIELQVMYPMPDRDTYANSHHRVAHPGMKWQCPVRCMGGSNPRIYEIVKGPAGLTLGQFLVRDSDGDYVADPDYGLLTLNNPVLGRYRIVIRCTDQLGAYVAIKFTLVVAYGKHMFIAPVARGTADGLTYENAKAESSVILNSGSSPALNRVMVLTAGEYTSTNEISLNKTAGSCSVIGYPGEVAIWKNKINYHSDDCTIGFITVKDASTTDFGIIRSYGGNHRLASYYNTFDHCFNADVPSANNQCVHGFSSAGAWRKNIVMFNNLYLDCDKLCAFDLYNCDTVLSQFDVWITSSNPALANQTKSVWFPKARYRQVEISFNRYDNPHVTGRASGIIQAYNGTDGNGFTQYVTSSHIEYNFINCSASEAAVASNGAANAPAGVTPFAVFTNKIRRNSILNGGVSSLNYDTSYGVNRRTHLNKNAIQTASGTPPSTTQMGILPLEQWFESTNPLSGVSLFTAAGKLKPEFSAQRGITGAQVYKP
jgi:hypothetical protein